MESKIYSINELDIKQHSFILLTSKRASGKTIMMLDLIKNLMNRYDYDFIVMFSDTASFLDEYKFLDKSFIFKTEDMNDIIKKNIKNSREK